MHRLLLIAARELKAYVCTASFWVALMIGPVLIGVAAMLAPALTHHPAPQPLLVASADPVLRDEALAAFKSLDQPATAASPQGLAGRAAIVLTRAADGRVQIELKNGASPSHDQQQAFVQALLRKEALRALAGAGADPTRVAEAERLQAGFLAPPPGPARHPADHGAFARFSVVMMLWLTLTGSLGMLLQAVVRERANRALESLMASARAWEIVFGKLAGVGAVSALVLAAWLGAGAVAAAAVGSGPLGALLAGLASPAMLAKAAVVYLVAFAMYGSATVSLSAMARDVAAAQNLSRPMFALLLMAFFASLAAAMGAASGLKWLVWAPPFTPFMLLLQPAGAPVWMWVGPACVMVASTLLIGAAASRCLAVAPGGRARRS
jgi:ABC-2 type transport system permease protein